MDPDRRQRTTVRILDAAAGVFARGGYAGTSMDEVATAAGVSKLLLYRDFTGKKQLYQSVLARTGQRIRDQVPAVASAATLRAMVDVGRSDPDGFILLFRHAAREPEFAGYATDLADWARTMVAELMRPVEPDPVMRRWAAEMATSIAFEGILTWLQYGDPTRDEEFFQRLLAVTWAVAKLTPPRIGPADAAV